VKPSESERPIHTAAARGVAEPLTIDAIAARMEAVDATRTIGSVPVSDVSLSRAERERIAERNEYERLRGEPYNHDAEFESDRATVMEFATEVISWERSHGR